MSPGAEETRGPAPGEVVVVGVEQPGAGPAADGEHQADDEEEDAGDEVQEDILKLVQFFGGTGFTGNEASLAIKSMICLGMTSNMHDDETNT